MDTATAIVHEWDKIATQEMASGITRQYVTTSRLTMAKFRLLRGAVVPPHKHEQEQVSYVVRGALRFTVGGQEMTVRSGSVLQIPSWVEHSVDVLEDTDVIDVFTPVRQDWLDGTDTYFKK
jgi:quercetin dioxygenase-like cupin family protein